MFKSSLVACCLVGSGLVIAQCSNPGPTQVSTEHAYVTKASLSQSFVAGFTAGYQSYYFTPSLAASLAYPGNLEALYRDHWDKRCVRIGFSTGSGFTWTSSVVAESQGNAVLCVNRADNLLQIAFIDNYGRLHLRYRINNTWYEGRTYDELKLVGSPAMIGNNQVPYNLEFIVQNNNKKYLHLYRESNQLWHVTTELPMYDGDQAYGDPVFAQTPDGTFHVAANVYNPSSDKYYLGYWTRIQSGGDYVWHIINRTSGIVPSMTPAIAALNDNTVEIIYKPDNNSMYARGVVFLKITPGSSQPVFDGCICPSESDLTYSFPSATAVNDDIYLSVYCPPPPLPFEPGPRPIEAFNPYNDSGSVDILRILRQ